MPEGVNAREDEDLLGKLTEKLQKEATESKEYALLQVEIERASARLKLN